MRWAYGGVYATNPQRRGEVVVDVAYASVTFVETMVRAGRAPHPSLVPALPVILGNGVAGLAGGARVVTTTGSLGGYAERAAVPRAGLIDVPDGLGLDATAALLADGRTAVGLIRGARIAPGETVLVEAAAGGVGSLLVQLARGTGARVIAAAGGERKLELARELGAGEAVDYSRPGWAEGLAADVVFDGVGGVVARAAFGTLRPGGRMCSFGLASGTWAKIEPEEAEAREVELVTAARPTRPGRAARRGGRRARRDRGARDGGEDPAGLQDLTPPTTGVRPRGAPK
ncbi:MAG TPA: zinc-binding dehydrogenase [Solirubrobacteraceae bacterium]|nr:zinc-binding dehydrogenase [Solirubrobacteraceae bacterium]